MPASRRAWIAAALLAALAGCGGGDPAADPSSALPPRTYVIQPKAALAAWDAVFARPRPR